MNTSLENLDRELVDLFNKLSIKTNREKPFKHNQNNIKIIGQEFKKI
jgi:hypothetical protein